MTKTEHPAEGQVPRNYAEAGMPNFPLPLSRDSSTVLTCAGLPFAIVQDFDDLRLLPRWEGYAMGNNNLTKAAQLIVEACNNHARLTERVRALESSLQDLVEISEGLIKNIADFSKDPRIKAEDSPRLTLARELLAPKP